MIIAKEAKAIQAAKELERKTKEQEAKANQEKLRTEQLKEIASTHLPNALKEIETLINTALNNNDEFAFYGIKANPLVEKLCDEIRAQLTKLGYRTLLLNLGPNELKNHPELSPFAIKIYWN